MDMDAIYEVVRDRMAESGLPVVPGVVDADRYVDLRRDGATALRVLFYDGIGGSFVNIAAADELGPPDRPGEVGGVVHVIRDGADNDRDMRAMLVTLGTALEGVAEPLDALSPGV